MTKEEREVMEMALDALEDWNFTMKPTPDEDIITAMKKCLANDALEKKAENARELGLDYEPEPLAFINVEQRKLEWAKYMTWDTPTVANLPKIPLYTTPPQRTWVGLTNEERNKLWREVVGWGDPSHDDEDLMKALEAKLKEKNT